MNLKLRTNVLAKSLEIEHFLGSLLAVLFRFDKGNSKTLGPNSSTLSFKNKTDFLKDLGRLDDKDYQDLIMFMEIRNALIHNIEVDTLVKALEKTNKVKKMLAHNSEFQKIYVTDNVNLKETILEASLTDLHWRNVNAIKRILDSVTIEFEELERHNKKAIESEVLMTQFEFMVNAIDSMSELFDKHFGFEENELKGLVKNGIMRFFIKQVKDKYPDSYEEFKKTYRK